jgi:hypothetical protein
MALPVRAYLFILFSIIVQSATGTETRAGFFLPNDVSEVTFKFKSINSLVILPVVINDTVKVNLILDTGCRNLVLFGKKFQKLFNTEPGKSIRFSGLGIGEPITGRLSLNNRVSIATAIGEKIPVVLIPQQNLFGSYPNIHGVIGYDIFVKFEIELNPRKQLITLRPALTAFLSAEYQKIPIRIEDSRPVVETQIFFTDKQAETCDIMIDTGSSLGLLIKTSDGNKFPKQTSKMKLGRGFNGSVMGVTASAKKLLLNGLEISVSGAGITYSEWHNYASVGMDILKDYTIVLNFCQAYVGFKKL